MKNLKHLFTLLILALFTQLLFTQNETQTIRGTVLDKQFETSLIGVAVEVISADNIQGAANYAGVNISNDARNDIVIRGNSPTGVLWRLEGVPISNPNYFSTLGTTGDQVHENIFTYRLNRSQGEIQQVN